MTQNYLVQASGLRIAYGSTSIFEDASFHIRTGEIVAFMGESGCGKTTLLKAIVNQVQLVAGTLEVRLTRQGGVSLLYQSPYAFPWLSVEHNLREATGLCGGEAHRRLDQVNLGRAASRRIYELSGGMLRRLGLLMALWGPQQLVLLDEPFAGLDDWTRLLAFSAVEEAQSEGKTIVLATHSAEEAVSMADRVYAVGGSAGVAILPQERLPQRPRYNLHGDAPEEVQLAVTKLRRKFRTWLLDHDD